MNAKTYDFDVVKPYVINFLKQHHWKVKDIMSFDDAVGEAQLQFWRTIIRLERRDCEIVNEKHLMSLFKTSWSRHFITLANKNTQSIKIVEMSPTDHEIFEKMVVGDLDNNGYCELVVEQAPGEIKQVILLLLKLPNEIMEVLTGLLRRDLIEPANLMISRMLGKNPNDHVLHKTIHYLKE